MAFLWNGMHCPCACYGKVVVAAFLKKLVRQPQQRAQVLSNLCASARVRQQQLLNYGVRRGLEFGS